MRISESLNKALVAGGGSLGATEILVNPASATQGVREGLSAPRQPVPTRPSVVVDVAPEDIRQAPAPTASAAHAGSAPGGRVDITA